MKVFEAYIAKENEYWFRIEDNQVGTILYYEGGTEEEVSRFAKKVYMRDVLGVETVEDYKSKVLEATPAGVLREMARSTIKAITDLPYDSLSFIRVREVDEKDIYGGYWYNHSICLYKSNGDIEFTAEYFALHRDFEVINGKHIYGVFGKSDGSLRCRTCGHTSNTHMLEAFDREVMYNHTCIGGKTYITNLYNSNVSYRDYVDRRSE